MKNKKVAIEISLVILVLFIFAVFCSVYINSKKIDVDPIPEGTVTKESVIEDIPSADESAAVVMAAEALRSAETLKIMNSIMWPKGSAENASTQDNTNKFIDSALVGAGQPFNFYLPNSAYNRSPKPGWVKLTNLSSTKYCASPISAYDAKLLKARFAILGIDLSSVFSDARKYVDWVDDNSVPSSPGFRLDRFIARILFYEKNPTQVKEYIQATPTFAYCLDKDFVSNYTAYRDNYPQFIDRVNKFYRSIPSRSSVPFVPFKVRDFNDGTDPIPYLSTTGNNTSSSGSSDNSEDTSISNAPTSTSYTVSVEYGRFKSDGTKYNYVSVNTGNTGTKSISISVFEFNDVSGISASAAIEKLSSLGYRPATLDEIYAGRSQIGYGVLGLGTNLGGDYGYPYTSSNTTTGLHRMNSPFTTAEFRFAAVRK